MVETGYLVTFFAFLCFHFIEVREENMVLRSRIGSAVIAFIIIIVCRSFVDLFIQLV